MFNYESSSWSAKVYERGPDNMIQKGKKRWLHKDCDRVRIEVTAKRPKLKLKEPSTIADLLTNPGFLQLLKPLDDSNRRHFDFKCFKHHTAFPAYYKEYPASNGNKTFDCFQEAYFTARKLRPSNLSQDVIKNKELKPLMTDIETAVEDFERKWVKKTKILTNLSD